MEYLNKILIGYKITHPNENITDMLTNIILKDKLDKYKINNYFKIEDNNLTKEQIINELYQKWCSNLDDHDYFFMANNYAIFIKDNIIYVIGHIDLEDLNNIESPIIKNLKRKDDKQICLYQVYSKGTYEIADIKIEVSKKGEINVNYEEVEYGKIEKEKYYNYKKKTYFLTKRYLNGEEIQKKDLEIIIRELSKNYTKTIDVNKVFIDSGFTIFENSYEFLTNAGNIKLENNISGKLLKGCIDISVNRGYEENPNIPQQDAALSIVKKENIFLNAVADGAGGSENGENASKETILELKKWFEIIPEELFEQENVILELLIQKISQIDEKIAKEYLKSYTTIALALTIYDKTLLVSVGDSTIYTYDEEKEELIMLNKLDSWTEETNYEEIRYDPSNNIITSAIGDGYEKKININIIDNNEQKIIISSDGVTDLICEERFKTYFTNDIDSGQIIKDALSKKDTKHLNKKEDNISVIIIKLSKTNKVKKLV